MKSINPALVTALVCAIAALASISMAQRMQNPYFTLAAGMFAIATYVSYPPQWATELAKMLPIRRKRD